MGSGPHGMERMRKGKGKDEGPPEPPSLRGVSLRPLQRLQLVSATLDLKNCCFIISPSYALPQEGSSAKERQ